MHLAHKLALTCAALALASVPAQAQFGTGPYELPAEAGVSALLDCHEEAGRTLISAHRGGPSPGLPENAIETMDAVLTAIPAVMEIDVAQSPDGVHYLMHDRTLDRTTTGSGSVTEVPWSEVEQLYLVDRAGWQTSYRVPTLRAALEWAKGKTVLQVDFKRTADFAEVVELIRETGTENSVILIAYSVGQAARLHELAPDMLLSLSIGSTANLEELRAAGIPDEAMVAFTGTRIPRPELYAQLDEQNIEVIFGTLGRPDRSLDGVFERFGTDERYAELGEGGVDIIATDRPRAAARALAAAGRLAEVGLCGVGRGQ